MTRFTEHLPTPPAAGSPASNGRAIRLAAAVLLVGLPVLANVACTTVRYTEAFSPEGEVRRVVLRVDSGLIEVSPGDKLLVERAIRAPEAALALSHEIVDGTLYLDAHCATLLPCAVDTRVVLPATLPVEIDLGEGEVWVSGVSDLSLEVDEGSADVELRGDLVASLGSGSLRARLDEDSQARVGVGRGDIEIEVPGGDWQVEAHTDRLRLVDLEPVPQATGSLQLTAPSGSVTVRATIGVADAG